MRRFVRLGLILALVTACSGPESQTGDTRCRPGSCDPGQVCVDGACVPESQIIDGKPALCRDLVLDGDESDKDCGGSCPPCEVGRACNAALDCDTEVCAAGLCRPPTCGDAIQNGDESDVDCGGTLCRKCPETKACSRGEDCESRVCLDGACYPAGCEDGTKNALETEADCGGGECPPCADGQACFKDTDCRSKVCDDGAPPRTCLAPRCDDAIRNGSETDLDCGGPACPPCLDLQACTQNSDCANGYCKDSLCTNAACYDQQRSPDETDVDCGGPTCRGCGQGLRCLLTRDCLSGVCDPVSLVCASSSCGDGAKNDQETDVDCGGPVCPGCGADKDCSSGADCASTLCNPATGKCLPSSCTDTLKNGLESDVDCGGATTCSRCPLNGRCTAGSDCGSGVCDTVNQICLAPTCSDGVLNGDESAPDCGGPSCPACGDGRVCRAGVDCLSKICSVGECAAARCDDRVRNQDESDVDCGGASGCPRCEDGASCAQGADCSSRYCDPTGHLCTSSCSDGFQNGPESDLDCGGRCAGCVVGRKCLVNADCASAVCDPLSKLCKAATCGDSVKNADETDIDCGGSCAGCPPGGSCQAPADCASRSCDELANVCQAPLCIDGIQNGAESDVDCGGGTCARCVGTGRCLTRADCVSDVCDPVTLRCLLASCSDSRKNGSETDADCGGTGGCARCAVGKACLAGADCSSGVCDPATATCKAPACGDGVKNGVETDLDCGGSGACLRCASGQACAASSDCASANCDAATHTCRPSSCADRIRNGEETDLDCGGGGGVNACAPCRDGKHCVTGSDCSSAVCSTATSTCTSSCTDGAQNGSETAVDCGGACAPCADGEWCNASTDCRSRVCDGTTHRCAAAACADAVRNGGETDIDCGGPEGSAACPRCGEGGQCKADADCRSRVCDVATHTCNATCTDGVRSGLETDVDCGGASACARCATGRACTAGSDCLTGSCNAQRLCADPTCSDGVPNGAETDVDCGGSCTACAIGKKCVRDADCASLVCNLTTLTCQSTCSDGLQDGTESDQDCGGGCPGCRLGKKCRTGADCWSKTCRADFTCSDALCNRGGTGGDGAINGNESDQDCGGDNTCDRCGTSRTCVVPVDCVSKVCLSGRCQSPVCTDGVQNGAESDIDCGGSCPTKCTNGKRCFSAADCASGLRCAYSATYLANVCQP